MKKVIKLTVIVLAFIVFASFADVPQNSNEQWGWAYPYVSYASDSGLMIGDGNGFFMPGDYTSKEQVAIIIYRILNYGTADMTPAERTLTEDENALLDRCQISDWARLYLIDGFKSGFWTEKDFAERSNTVPAGKQPLERQMVATWIIKAENIELSAISTLPYADFSSINSSSLKYVDACYRTGLMIGNDENKFNPSGSISRAEMAVVLTRALKLKRDTTESAAKAEFYGTLSVGTSTGLFTVTNGGHTSKIYIDPDSTILFNGSRSNMASIAALAGKTVSISTVIGTNVVLVQTKPTVFTAQIYDIEKRNGFDLITVEMAGAHVKFIKDQNTYCSKTLSVGTSIRFISDGCNLLEVN